MTRMDDSVGVATSDSESWQEHRDVDACFIGMMTLGRRTDSGLRDSSGNCEMRFVVDKQA